MKVLIVKISSMGDVIGILPSLTDAKVAIPDVSFDWVVEEGFSEIPYWHRAVDKVIPIALRRWRKKIWGKETIKEMHAFWKNLRERKYDYVVDSHGLLKSALVATMAFGKRAGFSRTNAREPLASYFYNNKFDIEKTLHVTERSRKLFSLALNYQITPGNPDYGIMTEKFQDKDLSNEKYLVFIHGASRDNKLWEEKNWIELANLVKTLGFKVKLPWGNEAEFARATNIANAASNTQVLPKTTLTAVGKVLFNAKGAIAVDTGFGHMAAALSVPTISLYGPTDPTRGGAYGKNQIHMTHIKTVNAQMVWQKFLSSNAVSSRRLSPLLWCMNTS